MPLLPRTWVNTASQPEHINVHAAGSRYPPALACTNLGRAHWQPQERAYASTLPSFSFRDVREELDALVFRGMVAYVVDLQGGVLYAELPVDYLL
jgi:hypothetical protein